MQVISLFSGIDGFDIPAEALGWKTILFCEIDPFCNLIIKHHYPDIPIHDNIKTLTYEKIKDYGWNPDEPTIIVGGFPCQPFSVAGKRKGKDDNRYLWPEMLRTISIVRRYSKRRTWILAENVSGLLTQSHGMVFEQVCSQVENEGYTVQPFIIPACAVNVPHRRDRIWFVAYAISERERRRAEFGTEHTEQDGEKKGITSDTNNSGCQYGQLDGSKLLESHSGRDKTAVNNTEIEINGDVADTDRTGLQERFPASITDRQKFNTGYFTDYWKNFPSQSPVCIGDDGISERLVRYLLSNSTGIYTEETAKKEAYRIISKIRKEAIKAAGNAVVPQVVFKIMKGINDIQSHL